MPKRSSGCFECRQRKVRCDEARPECNTCVRRGTKCPGYRPTQSFILHTFTEESERPGIIREDENRYRYSNLSQSPEGLSRGGAAVRLHPAHARPVDAPVPRQVSPIAIDRVQHLGNFLQLYLPMREAEMLTPPSALLLSLAATPASRNVFVASLDALSAAQLAVSDKTNVLINRSRSLYGTALSQLMKAISEPERAVENETLLATYLLTLYEVFVGVTAGHGFFFHVQGLLHLLQQRGPASFGHSRLDMQLFHGIRYNSLSIGYNFRKGSMLDSPEWLAVTAKAAKIDPYVSLLDICICIPRILERTDKLAQPSADPAADIERLIDDAKQLAGRAFEWIAHFSRDGPRYSKVDASSIDGFLDKCSDPELFNPVFAFKSFGTANMYCIYWMSMLILQSNTFGLLRRFRALEPKQLMLWDRELAGYADSICRGVPYSCRPAAGYVGRFGTFTPLIVARKYFEAKKAEREIKWCEAVFYGNRVPGLYSPPIEIKGVKIPGLRAQQGVTVAEGGK
ncbi:hypothetical protein BDV95DRAFT_312715 [Massariosphaeria phaeospora]|uniref:Zn(2)-C6 fungal-type domain-containing protein n=1 Tax=Massariosphaeria phaeospora TaxID=100035 RepID=A0A7C8IB68_9PLEO|nr:hypothetical protein BDV95DRAFT_312715 [Massariosphaeria phaeospora]